EIRVRCERFGLRFPRPKRDSNRAVPIKEGTTRERHDQNDAGAGDGHCPWSLAQYGRCRRSAGHGEDQEVESRSSRIARPPGRQGRGDQAGGRASHRRRAGRARLAQGQPRRAGLLRRVEPGAHRPQAQRQTEVRQPRRRDRPRGVARPRRGRLRAMRSRCTAPLLALLVTLGGAWPSFASDKQIDDVDAGEFRFGTMAIGQAKDVDYARAEGLGLVPASPLDTYLTGVLAKLLAQSPVKNVPGRVYVRASGDWAAKSTADANIYVAMGTLLRLDNEDEVAALLGHEASHIILGHANSAVVQSAQQRAIQLSTLAVDAADFVGPGQGPAGSGPGKDIAKRVRTDQQSKGLLLNTMLLMPAWTSEQERDAERLGTDLLVRAGYSPQAMASLLRKQKTFETERAADPQESTINQLFGYDTTQRVQEETAKATKDMGGGDVLGSLAGAALGSAVEWGA